MPEGSPQPNDGVLLPRPTATAGIQAPVWAHVLPFVLWLFLMQMLGDPTGWSYAVRTAAGVAALGYWRPWRWYPPLSARHLAPAVAIGLAVFAGWVILESPWTVRWPAMQSAYATWGILPVGRLPEPMEHRFYAPEVCGWPLTAVRILGSGLVISAIEEFFWRGFVYRWIVDQDFLNVDLGVFRPGAFVLAALFFGLEHQRWLAGFLCGLAYGWLVLRTRDIWAAATAHAVTNLVLGVYVVATDHYHFWS